MFVTRKHTHTHKHTHAVSSGALRLNLCPIPQAFALCVPSFGSSVLTHIYTHTHIHTHTSAPIVYRDMWGWRCHYLSKVHTHTHTTIHAHTHTHAHNCVRGLIRTLFWSFLCKVVFFSSFLYQGQVCRTQLRRPTHTRPSEQYKKGINVAKAKKWFLKQYRLYAYACICY